MMLSSGGEARKYVIDKICRKAEALLIVYDPASIEPFGVEISWKQ